MAILRKAPLWTAALVVAAVVVGIGAAPAVAGGKNTCSGTLDSPGTLAGTVHGNLTVQGACVVDAGAAVVTGNVTVAPGAALVALFGTGDSNLTVGGNFKVQNGGAAAIGCNPDSNPCADDPSLTSSDSIKGNFIASQALGVVIHNTSIGGNFEQHGGGGGFTCDTSPGVFGLFQSPVFSALEDSTVGGNLSISNVSSCWMGTARVDVGGNASYINNQLADPDAIEIVFNTIHGNLNCRGNSMTWDSGDLTDNLYPRAPQPNTVFGKRGGQCVLASPATEGGPFGPGPF